MRPSRRQMQPFLRRWSAGRASATVLLVSILAGAYASQWILETFQPDQFADPEWLKNGLGLHANSASAGRWWQFLTFALLHANPLHTLGDLLLIYFAGRELEPIVGPRQTAGIFCVGNFLGGLLHWIVNPAVALVGASAGAAALVAAYATTLPELEVTGHLFFLLPLKLRAKYFGLALALISAACWSTGTVSAVGPAGVFLGTLLGWGYARQLGFGNPFWFQRMMYERRQREARIARMPADQFVAEEVDPILEKIAAKGVASLTRSERQLLERGREKITAKGTGT